MIDFTPHLVQDVNEFNDDLVQFPVTDLNYISEESDENSQASESENDEPSN